MTELAPYPEYNDSGVEWLGETPSHWGRAQLRRVATIVNGGTPTPDEAHWGGSVAWATPVDLNTVDGHTIDSTLRTLTMEGLASGSALVPSGSVILSTRAPIGYSAMTRSPVAFNQGCKGLIPTRDIDSRFMLVTLQAAKAELARRGQGTTFLELSSSALGSVDVPLVPLEEQLAIADFVKRETAEIDAFIADQEELIGLLAERRDASWQSAIDSLSATEVPLRRIVDSVVDGPFGSSLTAAHYSESGARVIRLGNIGVNAFKDLDQAFIPMAYFAELSAHSVRGGDVVVAGLGDDRMPLGRAAVVPELGPAIVKADCYRVRANRLATSSFLAWVLSAPQTRARFGLMSRGSTRQRLNTSVVRDVLVPLPSIPEQERVVAETDEVIRELDATIADAHQAIALSKERRAALISAAVTGKIDVRGLA